MNKKNNRKGFTIVELVIVIAVIAILTAVAAPQYIKYVEKSRVAKDDNNAGSIRTAVETAIVDLNSDADPDNDISGDFDIVFDDSGITAPDDLQTELAATLGGSFDSSDLNNILTTTQNTNKTYTLKFDDAKFKELVKS